MPRCLLVLWLLLLVVPLRGAEKTQRQVWITNAFGNDVHIYEVGSWKLIKHLEVGPNPHGISATADGKTVHLALENFGGKSGELLFLNTRTYEVTGRVAVGPKPNENECTPDGRWIYVPCDDGHYWVIDGDQKTVATKIKTGGRPHNTLVSSDGKRMYLSPMGNPQRVTIVDTAEHKTLGEIPFGNSTRPPAMTSDEQRFFQNVDGLLGFEVASIPDRKVTRAVKHQIDDSLKATQSRCHGLCVRPDQKEIWSCNVEHQTLHIHDITSAEYPELATLKLPGRIYWVTFSPDSKFAFVSVRSQGQVVVIDTSTREIVTMLAAGKEPKRTQVIDVPIE